MPISPNEGAETLLLLSRSYWFQVNFSDVTHREPQVSQSIDEEISVHVELLAPAVPSPSPPPCHWRRLDSGAPGLKSAGRPMRWAELPSPSPALPSALLSLLIHLVPSEG